ncbi:MAG: phytanoyl-CoA dioxygenase family protein [Capsulimonadales bacterium]|nr:phytanoyl-CoA dioxygenase family protein [Capsulimonadales bacterium]
MNLRLSDAQRAQFVDEGYVMVPDLFSPEELRPLQEEIARIVDRTADQLRQEGRLTDVHASEGFETRLTRLLADHPSEAGTFFRAIEGKGGGGFTGRAMYDLLTHPALLDAMEDLLGTGEVVASSVYRIRPKVPNLGRGVVPWHQDSGYFAARCDDEMIVTCWIPLVDATEENGCLRVLPRTHLGPVVRHHTGGNAGFLVITEEDLPAPASEAVAVPVPLGGALLLTNRMPHCSTPNRSDTIRWSVDLRYQALDVPNNLSADIEPLIPDSGEVAIACYPPEADFVVRSRTRPETVADFQAFQRRREAFENARIPGPNRGWQPVATG